jgi:hypothetical protein
MKFEALEPAGADRRDIFRLDRRGFMNLVTCASTLSLGAGCSTLDRVAPMPPGVADQVTVLGIQNARFWPDTHGMSSSAKGSRPSIGNVRQRV